METINQERINSVTHPDAPAIMTGLKQSPRGPYGPDFQRALQLAGPVLLNTALSGTGISPTGREAIKAQLALLKSGETSTKVEPVLSLAAEYAQRINNSPDAGVLPKEYRWQIISPDETKQCSACINHRHFDSDDTQYCKLNSIATWEGATCKAFTPKPTEDTMATEPELPTVGEMIAATDTALPTKPDAAQAAQIQVGELIGMVKAFDFMKKLTTVGTLKVLAQIKESKQYKGLTLTGQDGELTTVGTWADFCGAIGQSVNKVDEDLLNLATFGETFMESSNRLGLGYREIRKLRKLPEDDRTVVLENVEIAVSDKTAIVSLIDDLAAKHHRDKAALEAQYAQEKEVAASEKSALEKKLEETTNQLTASRTRVQTLVEENNNLKEAEEVRKLSPPDPDEESERIRDYLTKTAGQIKANIAAGLRKGILELDGQANLTGINEKPFLAGLLIDLEQAINILRADFQIPAKLDGDPTPEWLRPGFDPLKAAHGLPQDFKE